MSDTDNQPTIIQLTGNEIIIFNKATFASFLRHNAGLDHKLAFPQNVIDYIQSHKDMIIIPGPTFNHLRDHSDQFYKKNGLHDFPGRVMSIRDHRDERVHTIYKKYIDHAKDNPDDSEKYQAFFGSDKSAEHAYSLAKTAAQEMSKIIQLSEKVPIVLLTDDPKLLKFNDALDEISVKKLAIILPENFKIKQTALPDDTKIVLDKDPLIMLVEDTLSAGNCINYSPEALRYLSGSRDKIIIPKNVYDDAYKTLSHSDLLGTIKILENFAECVQTPKEIEFDKINDICKQVDPTSSKTTIRYLYSNVDEVHIDARDTLRYLQDKATEDLKLLAYAAHLVNSNPIIFITNNSDFVSLQNDFQINENRLFITRPSHLEVPDMPPIEFPNLAEHTSATIITDANITKMLFDDIVGKTKYFSNHCKMFLMANSKDIIIPKMIGDETADLYKQQQNKEPQKAEQYQTNLPDINEEEIIKIYQKAVNNPFSRVSEHWLYSKAEQIRKNINIDINADSSINKRLEALNYLFACKRSEKIAQIIQLSHDKETIFFTNDTNFLSFRDELEQLAPAGQLRILNPFNY